jgi:hypothetical protein
MTKDAIILDSRSLSSGFGSIFYSGSFFLLSLTRGPERSLRSLYNLDRKSCDAGLSHKPCDVIFSRKSCDFSA